MRTTFATILVLAIAHFASDAGAEIVKQTIEYELPGGATAKGVAVYDDAAEGKRPGVLVIPEWWGLTDYPQMRAEQLARQGYVAFVADMYGEGKTTQDPQQAGQWATAASQAGLANLAKPALDQLAAMEQVDGEKLAAIGFCFGGGTVVAMAGSDYASELTAVVSFHGTLGPDAAPQGEGEYNGPAMLVLHGGADPMVKPEAIGGFVQRCIAAGVPISVTSFPDAVHAFTNPGATALAEKIPSMKGAIAYDEQAERISMEIMEEFLEMTVGEVDEDREEDDAE